MLDRHLVLGHVVGVYIDDRFITDGPLRHHGRAPIARCGYHDYAVVDEVFSLVRPAAPAAEEATAPNTLPCSAEPGQQPLGSAQVRAVEHLAIQADDADAWVSAKAPRSAGSRRHGLARA